MYANEKKVPKNKIVIEKSIFNTPICFNPKPTFLGVNFNQILSFKNQFITMKEASHLNSCLSLYSLASGEISYLCILYKTFFCLILPMLLQVYFSSRSHPYHHREINAQILLQSPHRLSVIYSDSSVILYLEVLLLPLRVTFIINLFFILNVF